MFEKLKTYFLRPRFTFNRLQFNLIALLFISFGLIIGFYITLSNFIPRIFASTSPWIQTDWSGGSASGMVNTAVNTYSSTSNTDPTTSMGNLTLATNPGWYNTGWKYRRKLTFDNTTSNLGVTSEALTDFSVLLVLTSSNIDYTSTQDSGQDLRFTDSDGTTLLSYEIEKWDEAGTSYVWVKVPQIDINSSTDYIYMYYGNSGANDAQNADNTWDNNYVSVWHMDETSGTAISDSAGSNTGTKLSSADPQVISGQIDGAQDFSADYISVADSAGLDLTGSMTLSGWVTADTISTWGSILMKSTTGSWDNGYGIYYNSGLCAFVTNYNTYKICSSFTTTGTPRYVVATYTGSEMRLYINGAETGSSSVSVTISTNNANLQIGRGAGGSYDWDGLIDEVRISNTARSAAHVAASYHSETNDFVAFDSQVGTYFSPGTLTSNIFDTEQPSAWGNLTYSASGSTIAVKVRSSNSVTMSGAHDWSICSAIPSGTDLSSTDCVTDAERYIQYQITLSTADQIQTPTFQDISIAFSAYDSTPPITNASSIIMATASSGGRNITSNGWNNAAGPYFSWTAGSDNAGGSGLKGYCLYLGTDSSGNPATAKGVLGTSPGSLSGSTCQFIVSSTSVNLSTFGYLSSSLTDGSTYYLNIKAIDNGNNIFGGSSAAFHFKQDTTPPTNVSYISAPSTVFGNVDDMSFNWPLSGGSAATDTNSGVIGWQYSLDSGSTWRGPDTESTLGITYIEDDSATSSHTLSDLIDGSDIQEGINTVYFRTVDEAGNFSSGSTYRTAPLNFGGEAPSFAIACDLSTGITITPSTSTSNSFSLSWDAASATGGNTVSGYYYMINTSPPATLSTLESNSTQYIANTTTSVAATKLTGSVKGANTVYVVAYDNQDHYSQSNCLKGTYTLNSTLPDPVQNLSASDASIKSEELWRASLSWGEPLYKGTGTLTYIIQRSTDNSSWTTITTTSGTSYTDTVTSSAIYYFRVGTYDTTSESQSAPTYSTSVSVLPKGTWDSAPGLSSGPTVTGVTTKKATISWSTSRASDSKVQYGRSSGSYFNEEPSNSTQTTDHSINLTNLTPGTSYYYKVKWTDEDGNTGVSSERTFSTGAAPIVTDPKIKNVSLTSVNVEYTVKGANSVKFYYGKTAGFGSTKAVSTSTSETTYTTTLEDLDDGTKYYYKINTFDSEESEYESNILTFETLPRPRITNIRVQQVARTAQPSVLVTWTTNTEVSSIITYYPQNSTADARDEINVALKKGEHQMIVRGLYPQTRYAMIIKGRDKAGNEAESDVQTFTTATDTRPPQITDLKVEGANASQAVSTGQKQQQQLVVSWNTDEAATAQIEFGEGTGSTYSQKTQEDSNLAFNHVVVISGLSPSKVYHLRVLSKDKAGNAGNSVDTVTITPKSSDNALDLVITNLQQIFGFIGR